ncbi:tRNA pseudouridine(55) synthase TruB [Gordonibacter sp. An230]|uniref:tRNA pseudouridine(55) synthase TruB n=1 Tax=Gordonibacter sp. An230 TaxID=1965592 RepID=UPI000B383DBE|nr:tRNA pseudouridine(55) synthase TruB [Gordonibacter sp. An230]OUO90315.1 tRNA pseudouridine(55) synthase TruB [Gordonibacter sp. An230]
MKRGTSGLSLVVGVNKPAGMSSHDVVNRCRRIFGERRVGHTGTLDPLATGVLPVCVGPATRLGAYLTGHDKRYRVRVAFGAGTDTDDAEGRVLRTGPIPERVLDPQFARAFVASLVGARKQMPPAYSAVKVGGTKSYEAARAGSIIELKPRDIVVHDAILLGVREAGDGYDLPSWDVEFHVSKGTYIRALARDAGSALGCPAHVAALERTALGLLSLEECVSLETLTDLGDRAALDPVRLLGVRFSFAQGDLATRVANGASLEAAELSLFERRRTTSTAELCACTAGVRESCEPPRDGEVVAVVSDNKLVALYGYEAARDRFKARCVFQTGVSRGRDC